MDKNYYQQLYICFLGLISIKLHNEDESCSLLVKLHYNLAHNNTCPAQNHLQFEIHKSNNPNPLKLKKDIIMTKS